MSLDLKPGSIVDGRYEVVSTLGRGGYATVLHARQVSTGQDVALKLLMADELYAAQIAVQRARFEREMALIGRLQHPNIVRLIDSGTLPSGDHYSVLEYVQGYDLSAWLARHGPLPVAEAAHLMTQVLDALSCAHSLGIVHRDLKPGNIMVTTSSARRNAMVLDFGIAGIVESSRDSEYQSLTLAGTVMGSPSYMSPEQVRGDAPTVQSDIYSWGLVFAECLTGRKLIEGLTPHQIMASHLLPEPNEVPRAIVSPRLRSILARCIAKSLEERFTSVQAVMAALAAWKPSDGDVDLSPTLAAGGDPTVPVNTDDPRVASLIAAFRERNEPAPGDTSLALAEPPTMSVDVVGAAPAPVSLAPVASLADSEASASLADTTDSAALVDVAEVDAALAQEEEHAPQTVAMAPVHAMAGFNAVAEVPPTHQLSRSEIDAIRADAGLEPELEGAPTVGALAPVARKRWLIWLWLGSLVGVLIWVVFMLL